MFSPAETAGPLEGRILDLGLVQPDVLAWFDPTCYQSQAFGYPSTQFPIPLPLKLLAG